MDIDLITNPSLLPKPRDQIKIEHIKARFFHGGARIGVELDITPFLPADRPSIEIAVLNPQKDEIASTHVVETMHRNIGLTMHLRESITTTGTYHIKANLFYADDVIQNSIETTIDPAS